jgi:thiazole synthase ThiGH ThiG subunit
MKVFAVELKSRLLLGALKCPPLDVTAKSVRAAET